MHICTNAQMHQHTYMHTYTHNTHVVQPARVGSGLEIRKNVVGIQHGVLELGDLLLVVQIHALENLLLSAEILQEFLCMCVCMYVCYVSDIWYNICVLRKRYMV